MFETYNRDQVNATDVDERWIMLYRIPPKMDAQWVQLEDKRRLVRARQNICSGPTQLPQKWPARDGLTYGSCGLEAIFLPFGVG